MYIATNLSSLSDSIKKLEERNLELVKALEIFHLALKKTSLAYGDIDKKISKKCDQIVAKNPGVKIIEKIRGIIVGGEEVQVETNIAQHAMYFKYATLTSVEVERSFSKLKMILSDQQLSIKTENVKNN